jgi:hypothetical protein
VSGENPNVIVRNADGTPLQSAFVSALNSTTTPPRIASPFVGGTEYIINYVGISITLATEQSTLHQGSLYFEFSPDDGVHWDISVPIYYTSANPFVPFPLRKVQPWFRVRYEPEDDNLTAFRLQVIYHPLVPETLTRLLSQNIALDEPIKIVRAGLMAVAPSGLAMQNLQASTAGLLVDQAGGPLIPGKYDTVNLGYDGNGNVTSVAYLLQGNPVATLTLSYDSNNNLLSIARA